METTEQAATRRLLMSADGARLGNGCIQILGSSPTKVNPHPVRPDGRQVLRTG